MFVLGASASAQRVITETEEAVLIQTQWLHLAPPRVHMLQIVQ